MRLGHCINGCNAVCKSKECSQHLINYDGLCNGCVKKMEADTRKWNLATHSVKCVCVHCSDRKLREKRSRKHKARKEYAARKERADPQGVLDF